MAITGIDTLDGKQIIAAGASSAVKAAQDGNGNIITATYQTTAGMSDYATTASVSGKQDTLTFGYTDNQISQINGSGIYSQGGTSYTGNVQEALDKVYTDSATWDNISAKQDKLTFNYDGSNNITGINSSAIGGGGGGVVTATGGTNDYIQTINEKPISATIATYAPNGASLDSTFNYAASGYAASAYLASNVTGNVANWTDTTNTVLSNSGYWGRICRSYDQNDIPSLTGTAGLGPAGLRFNIGSMITYDGLTYRVTIENLDNYMSAYNLAFSFNNVIGTQWSQVNDVISVRNGHIISPYIINIWACWENEPRIQLVNSETYITSGPAILRNVRNASTSDNNKYYGNGIIYVASW